MQRGLRTTEFWVTAATNAGLVGSALAGVLSPRWAAVATAASTAAYSIARGLAKHGGASGGP